MNALINVSGRFTDDIFIANYKKLYNPQGQQWACQTRNIMPILKEREVFIMESFPVSFHLFKRRMFKVAVITLEGFLSCFFKMFINLTFYIKALI